MELCHMLYLCICEFVFVYLRVQNIIFDVLGPLAFQKYSICWVYLALVICCICVFVFVYLCICVYEYMSICSCVFCPQTLLEDNFGQSVLIIYVVEYCCKEIRNQNMRNPCNQNEKSM